MVVKEGSVYADRTFLCTSDSSADVVGTDPLAFTYVAQSLTQVAGINATALRHNTTTASLEVRTRLLFKIRPPLPGGRGVQPASKNGPIFLSKTRSMVPASQLFGDHFDPPR